jgi:polygalacturonase
MKKSSAIILLSFLLFSILSCKTTEIHKSSQFPDGSAMIGWFADTTRINIVKSGKQYLVTDFGAVGDGFTLNTAFIQKTIDAASKAGGGVIVIPEGRFLSGALFFKPGTHLHLLENGILLGSDTIADFPLIPSRMEGQCLDYFAAVVNAYGVNNFTISGPGTIDGNGLKFWEAFWRRRAVNPNCTNLEVSRPRLIFIRNCNNVQIQDVRLKNSGFWTTHLYKCNYVRLINLSITSPFEPVKAPSTDAIDIDACNNVLVHGCYMSVNDDAIALKGGKGPWADTDTTNGPNFNIVIQHCNFGLCHSALTCGSEAIHNRNIIMRNCRVNGADRVLWLKMRPDTPQKYEYITVENITGKAGRLLFARPWRQFFDLQGRETLPPSVCQNITLKNIDLECSVFADIDLSQNDSLKNFTLENLKITAKNDILKRNLFSGLTLKNVIVNGKLVE